MQQKIIYIVDQVSERASKSPASALCVLLLCHSSFVGFHDKMGHGLWEWKEWVMGNGGLKRV